MTNTLRTTAALLFALAAAPLLPAAEIIPLSGKPVRGTVTGVDAQFVTFKDEANAEFKAIMIKLQFSNAIFDSRIAKKTSAPGRVKSRLSA